MLPVHWAAAANNSFLTLFTSLCVAAWLYAALAQRPWRAALLMTAPLLLALALLSKESAVLTVGLMMVMQLFTASWRMRRGEWFSLLACVLVSAIWLVLRARFEAQTDDTYQLELGGNVLRNGLAFVAWMLNVPREALRMAVTGNRLLALAWVAATALPMLIAMFLGFWQRRSRLSGRQWACMVMFAGLAYGPYFLLAWNSYAYYAAIAAILPVIVLARCGLDHPRLLLMLGLIAVSSWVAVQGTRMLDHPGLIGRARWGERLLTDLKHRKVTTPLWVQVPDQHRFYAVGVAGLSWRLGLPSHAIHVTRHCPTKAHQCLKIDEHGDWQLTAPLR
ncbi:hypothetical protein [Oleiagrimonas sp. C23AA]|uniref:hypothetical protein n=1 Tax=Oleiagrimonas sp. C23AA TaxID=2719047 RepID=UPI0014206424|nr:hypothetical protein [Oleiagrimonas sp. C23AA]NII09509.1 hypothetical protein [Oleiagrimonas sp. C23AA]